MLYTLLLALHSLVRWLVLAGMGWALVVIYQDLFRRRPWSERDRMAGSLFTSVLGLQFLLGIVLYVVSPFNAMALDDFGTAMSNAVLRFFALEHPLQMLAAVVIAQAGYSVSKRARTDRRKFWWAAICYTLAAILILAAIPWPPLPHGRPLLRGMGGA